MKRKKSIKNVHFISKTATDPIDNANQSPSISDSTDEQNISKANFNKKKRRLHTYERVRLIYDRIQAEKATERQRKQEERECREKALNSYRNLKRRMDKALLKRNKRGQPNLNAQIEVLLEKIQKRTDEDSA